jgi:hypothetical protein
VQPVFGGVTDFFVAQLSLGGKPLLFSTYLGGATVDQSNTLAIDGADNVYVGGRSNGDFPMAGTPFQATPAGDIEGLIIKLEIGAATPTATTTPAATSASTPTATATATGTATPTATAMANIWRVYMPGVFYNAVWP